MNGLAPFFEPFFGCLEPLFERFLAFRLGGYAPFYTYMKEKMYFCSENQTLRLMCTITINVDEDVLRGMDPKLNTVAEIRRWAQQLVDLRIQELLDQNEETMDLETARELMHDMVRKEYASL